MANLPEVAQWDAGVYQIETTDPAVGGVDGIDNKAARNLANRTAYLKAQLDALVAEVGALGIPDIADLQTQLDARLPIYAAVPAAQAEDLIYVSPYGIMGWNATYGLYRAIECGQLVIHTSALAKPGTIKASGSLLSKTTYKGLWTQALDDGLTVAAGNWSAGTLQYEDYDANQFRVPMLGGEFIRFFDDGRGVDSGRVFGSAQLDALQNITGSATHISQSFGASGSGSGALYKSDSGPSDSSTPINVDSSNAGTLAFDASRIARTASETRPRNLALLACIKY